MKRLICLAALLCMLTTAWAQLSFSPNEPIVTYKANGKLDLSYHPIYDNKGVLKVCIIYQYNDSTGAVETRTLNAYNNKKQIIRTEQYSVDELTLLIEDFKYDKKGRLKRRIQKLYDDYGEYFTTYDFRYTYPNRNNADNPEITINGVAMKEVDY